MPGSGEPNDGVPRWRWFIFFAIAASAFWLFVGYNVLFILTYYGKYFTGVDFEKTGQLGDTFGAVNALFTALGLAGLIYTLILQIKEQKNTARRERVSRRHASDLAMLASLVEGKAAACSYFDDQHAKCIAQMNASVNNANDAGNSINDILNQMGPLAPGQPGARGPTPGRTPQSDHQQYMRLSSRLSEQIRQRDMYGGRAANSETAAQLARNRAYLAAIELGALTLYAENQLGRSGLGAEEGERISWADSKHEYMELAEASGYQSIYLPRGWNMPVPPGLRAWQVERSAPGFDPVSAPGQEPVPGHGPVPEPRPAPGSGTTPAPEG